MPTSASSPARKGFDYNSLDAETTQFIQQQTGEIRVLMKRTAQGIIKIGSRLLEVKNILGHGRFGAWLEAEFDWGLTTAWQFMKVAEVFKSSEIENLNFASSALYELAAPSTPELARSEALARAEAGEPITYKVAKAIKQKYTLPSARTKAEPELEPEIEVIPQLQSSAVPQPLLPLEPKPQIVTLRRGEQPIGSQQPQSIPQSSARTLEPPGTWWHLGERHLLYCGEPNSLEFMNRIMKEIHLLLAFPPDSAWQPAIQATTRIVSAQYLPIGKSLDQLDELLESAILFHSRLEDLVVSCFLPSPEILSIINRLGRRGMFAEPDSRRCNAVISDWRKAGLKAERLS